MTQQQTVDNVTGMVSETDWQFNNNGMLTEKDDYDYGQGTHGGPLRETVYPSYHTFSNPYIVDKPDGVQLLDGGRNVVAGVSYTYDPANANRLSISTWLNASGTSSLTTNLQYDTFGNVIWVKDPQQNYTQYSYSDAFADTCTFTSPSNTYLTQITQMPTNGVLHQENFTYYCASGLLASSMDENTQTTSYYYQDPLNRLTKIIYPTNGNPLRITIPRILSRQSVSTPMPQFGRIALRSTTEHIGPSRKARPAGRRQRRGTAKTHVTTDWAMCSIAPMPTRPACLLQPEDRFARLKATVIPMMLLGAGFRLRIRTPLRLRRAIWGGQWT
jgi:hypothetical protein